MKTNHLLLLLLTAGFAACASSEQRASKETDTNTFKHKDTTGTDTVTSVDGRSGDNGAGKDTTNTAEQKAIRESGNKQPDQHQ